MYIVLLLQVVCGTLTLDEPVGLTFDVSQASSTDIESTIEINGISYTSVCECSSPKLTEEEHVNCAPTKITLTQEMEGDGATIEEMEAKLETSPFNFAKIPYSSFRCIDGRITTESLGAFGGDLGEFSIGLLVYEDLSGKRVNEQDVLLYLTEYLECMQQTNFY